jgi:putative tricarboxylic transport membrane protein
MRQTAAELLIGAAIVAVGGWVLWQAFGMREGPGYAAVGPRIFPIIVGVGFALSGLAVVASAGRAWLMQPSNRNADSEPADPADWSTLAAIAVLLAVYVLLFPSLGFIIASAAFLVAGAWALGSRSPLRDAAAGVLLSGITYVVFTRLLGLELPEGPLADPIDALQRLIGDSGEA